MRFAFLATLALLVGSTSQAQQPPAPGALCKQANYRQFDFWVGDWNVYSAQDASKKVGENRIEKILHDCVLQENWMGSLGGGGKSFNSYDPMRKQWTQYWVDGFGGEPLLLRGGWVKNAMILSGEQTDPKSGKKQHQRVTWTPRKDGSVRQHWEQSFDGITWTTSFDGIYIRKAVLLDAKAK